MSFITVDYKNFDELQKAMEEYGSESLKVINEVFQNEAAEEIKKNIHKLLPVSGRKWRGKKAAAKSTQPFTQESEMLSVTVKSKPAYDYLYFPDDGSTTKRHHGNQQFMSRGAEASKGKIIDLCVGKLTEKIGG